MTPFGVVMSEPLGNRLAPALGILTDVSHTRWSAPSGVCAAVPDPCSGRFYSTPCDGG